MPISTRNTLTKASTLRTALMIIENSFKWTFTPCATKGLPNIKGISNAELVEGFRLFFINK